jgi:hypothetical protein
VRDVRSRRASFVALAVRAHFRAWYLLGVSLVPPLWAATDWHSYTHVGGRAYLVSYAALVVSPALFVTGARRMFDLSPRDDPPQGS